MPVRSSPFGDEPAMQLGLYETNCGALGFATLGCHRASATLSCHRASATHSRCHCDCALRCLLFTLPRAHACLLAFLFACTCVHCDCVQVDACLNLVCSIVCGDVRCPGSCLVLVLCFALLALSRLLSCLHCTALAPFSSLLDYQEQILTLENSQEENSISCFTSGGGNARQFFLRCTTHRDAPEASLHVAMRCLFFV